MIVVLLAHLTHVSWNFETSSSFSKDYVDVGWVRFILLIASWPLDSDGAKTDFLWPLGMYLEKDGEIRALAG